MFRILQTFSALISFRKQTRPVKNAVFLTCFLFLGLFNPVISFSQSYQQISLTGFNHDLVANVSNLPASSSTSSQMDVQGNVMYVRGYQCSPSSNLQYGLPVNGSITSASNSALTYQLQPYSQNNALFLTSGAGTLTFGTSGSYDLISILATSSESSSSFSATLNFSDGTSSSYSFYVPDWYNGSPYAFTNFGRVRWSFCGTDESAGNPRFYDNVITLNAADKQKLLKSVTFNKSGSGYTSIFAITGRTVVNAPSIPLNPFANNISSAGFTANWSAVSGAASYRLDVGTNADFSIFVTGYNNAPVGNVTALNVPATAGTYYFRVRAVNGAGQSLSSSTAAAVVPSACIAPVISNCPQTQYEQIYSDANSCSKVFTYNPAISGTNPNVSYTFTGATTGSGSGTGSGSAFNVGQTTVTISASNDCGLTKCSFVVTVIDDVPPTIKTKNIKVYLNAAGTASISPQDINDGSYDNCGPVTLSFNSGTICGVGAENQNVTLTAPAGEKITGIAFASYGTPGGSCGNFSLGWCHAANSISKVSPYLIGKNAGTVPATNNLFGDPCGGTVKRLYIQATYGATSSQSFTFDCSKLGDNQVTLLVTDANGKVSSEKATVTVIDNIAPTISNAMPVIVGNDTGQCGAVVSLAIPPASDNCRVASITNDAPAFFPSGTTTVTWTVKDASGLSATTTQEVTVNDTEAPVPTLPALATVIGACSATVPAPTATDNCSGEVTATTADPTSYTAQGTYTITWTYTDAAGNTATQTQEVIVKDVTAPSIASASAVSVTTDAGVCGATVELSVPATSDNCGVASVTNDAPSLFPVGTTTVTWTVTDVNGLSATTTQTVIVNDTESPVAVAKNITVQLEANGTLTLSPAQVDNGSTDNCGIASLTLDKVAFDCANIGTNPVVLTVTDLNGNVSAVSAVVTVEDKTAPTVLTRNLTIQLDATGNTPAITADQINNGSTDACGIASVTIDKTTFTCANAGANTLTLTVTDIHGNVGTATAIVTVQDVIAPVARARKYYWVTIKNGTASVTAEQLNNGSSDVCGIASMTVSPATFSCDNIGANTVTLTVTDPSGNVSTATSTVYVLGVAPVAKIRVSKCEDKNCSGKHDHDDDDDDYDDDDKDDKDNKYDKDDDKWKNGKKDLATQLDPLTIYLGYGEQSMVLSAAASKGLGYGSTYSWTGNGPLSSTTSARPRFTATAAGTYTFNVVVTNAFGCSAAASVTIKVIDVRCGNKVLVCHKGQQLCLPASAVKAHLAHGDLIGGCQTNAAPNARMAADFGQADAADLTIYPNPMATRAQLEFVLAEAGAYRLEVYDMKGALVKVLGRGQAEAGNLQAYDLDATKLSEGVYLVKLVTDTQVITKRFVVKR